MKMKVKGIGTKTFRIHASYGTKRYVIKTGDTGGQVLRK